MNATLRRPLGSVAVKLGVAASDRHRTLPLDVPGQESRIVAGLQSAVQIIPGIPKSDYEKLIPEVWAIRSTPPSAATTLGVVG